MGVKVQFPLVVAHESSVQALLSLHTLGVLLHPVAASHVSIVHAMLSSQFAGV
jgi:hypothetical protein